MFAPDTFRGTTLRVFRLCLVSEFALLLSRCLLQLNEYDSKPATQPNPPNGLILMLLVSCFLLRYDLYSIPLCYVSGGIRTEEPGADRAATRPRV